MRNPENEIETNTVRERNAAVHAVAALIRQGSEAGQLTSASEIAHRLMDQHRRTSQAADPEKEAERILREAVERNEDLHELINQDDSRHYYSSLFMTEAYAGMLHQKQNNHLQLIAETVRQNSALYPRPVPLDMFTQPPFDLPRQEVLNNIQRMAAEEEYRDIRQTATSVSGVFLYSTLHLDSEYASMLAEWLDVGQFENP